MDVFVDNQQEDLKLDLSRVSPLVEAVLSLEGRACDEVGVHFVSTEGICSLHAEYFDDPSPTDCISFPIDPTNLAPYCELSEGNIDRSEGDGSFLQNYRPLGDVFVCPATAIEYVESNGGDLYEELTLYVVHSLLHLLGYDDIEEEDCRIMRLAEARHLAHLKISGLLLS